MNILVLNYEWPPLGGGAGRACERMISWFVDNVPSLSIQVVTGSSSSSFTKTLSSAVSVHGLDIAKRGDIHHQSLGELARFYLSARLYINHLFAQNNFDLVHCFFSIPCGMVGYAMRSRCQYIVSLRGSDVPGYSRRFTLVYPFITPLIRRICAKSCAVIANSSALKDLATRSLPHIPIAVIPNGISTTSSMLSTKKTDSRIAILFVGRLIPRKGVDNLIEACALLPPSIAWHLDIAGTGPHLRMYVAQAATLGLMEKITFHGLCGEEELDELYRNADIFVLPSYNEGMSNALLEAMAHGLPVIVTDTGGTRELFDDNGIIIPMRDSVAIARAITELSGCQEQLLKCGKKSKAIADAYSIERVAQSYLTLYETICHKQKHI